MKSVLKFWAAVLGVLIVVWGLLRLYDSTFTNGDGLLADFDLDLLFGYLLGLSTALGLVLLGTKSRLGWVANASASLFGLLCFWIVAEMVCFGLIGLGITDAPRPFHSRVWLNPQWYAPRASFWGDLSPEFGRWRLPNSSMRVPICNGDSVLLTSNSFGMRDAERQLENPGREKRALLLGDSFMEGYLVNAPQRYSNRLEAETGREHLNFGINGTSPINYYLTYKFLASRFDHDVVIVSLLPANDFEDYTESDKLSLLRYPIYRPYWRGKFPKVNLAHSLKNIRQSIASPALHNEPVLVQQTVDSVYHSLQWGKKLVAEIQLNSYVYNCALYWVGKAASHNSAVKNSFAKENFESRWSTFAYSLEALLIAAQGKKVIFLGMPVLTDVQAYDQHSIDDFSPMVASLCRKYGAHYINLLPVIHAQGVGNWSSFYVVCDGHFSAKGEKLVALTLFGNPVYRRVMGLDSALDSQRQQAFSFKEKR